MHIGCQSIFDRNGKTLFEGEWNPLAIFNTLAPDAEYWRGRRVLDIGANTSGLSVEIARRGASVVAAEPDPYKNAKARAQDVLNQIIEEESLELDLVNHDLFGVTELGTFDTVLCLGLLYHFRYPQYILDMLSIVTDEHLFIGCQTAAGDDLLMINRKDPKCISKADFIPDNTILCGWHPTRPLLERMLEFAGFSSVTPLSDPEINFPKKPEGHTNSAYYRATKLSTVRPEEAMREYYPR